MNPRLVLTAGLTVVCALGIMTTPVHGGVILIGGEDGTSDPPAPTQGAQTEEDWNPTVTCTIGEGEGILELLVCLENQISNPPPACPPAITTPSSPSTGPVKLQVVDDPEPCIDYPQARADFNVWPLWPPPDRWGIEIRRLDGNEIQRLTLRENDPGIQTTELQLNARGRVARIKMVVEQPTGVGSVIVMVNDIQVSVPTSLFPTAIAVNAEIVRQLLLAPFDLTVGGGFINVSARRGLMDGVRRVQFRSSDPGIVVSDLSLLPDGNVQPNRDDEAIPLE